MGSLVLQKSLSLFFLKFPFSGEARTSKKWWWEGARSCGLGGRRLLVGMQKRVSLSRKGSSGEGTE
jgi:hypothetical protein